MRKLLILFTLLATSQCWFGPGAEDRVLIDFSMVEKTVGWLELIRNGADDATVREHFMREIAPTRGCKSIIRHWRRFMTWGNDEFYRFIMEALGRIPTDRAVRDESGNLTRFGMRQLFWRSALDDPQRIRNDLEELRAADLVDTSLALAKRYLPDDAVVRSQFYVVLFGGSSAYAVGSANGFDLLQLPKRPDGGIDVENVVRTFAHEMHHTGIRASQKKWMSGIRAKDRFGLLARLVNEGMPIHYINQTRDRLENLLGSADATLQAIARDWTRHLARLDDLYS